MKAKRIKYFRKCGCWVRGKGHTSPTNRGRKGERLREMAPGKSMVRELIYASVQRCWIERRKGKRQACWRSLLVLRLWSASRRGLWWTRTLMRTSSWKCFSSTRERFVCRITKGWVLGHREELNQVRFPFISRELTLVVRSNDQVIETICLMVKKNIIGSIWQYDFLFLPKSDFCLGKLFVQNLFPFWSTLWKLRLTV